MIQFTKPAGQSVTAVQKIKGEVGTAVEGAGLPRKAFLTISDKPIEGYDSIEGGASLSAKDGRVMYNFGAKASLVGQGGRLQGNFFLPKDGWTVDAATLKAYQEARAAQDAARTASKLKK